MCVLLVVNDIHGMDLQHDPMKAAITTCCGTDVSSVPSQTSAVVSSDGEREYKAAVMAITGSVKPMAAHYAAGTQPEDMLFVPYGDPSLQGQLHDRLYDYTIVAARDISSYAKVPQECVDILLLKEINVANGLAQASPEELRRKMACYFKVVIMPLFMQVATTSGLPLPTQGQLEKYQRTLITCMTNFSCKPDIKTLVALDDALHTFDLLSLELAPL